MRILLFAFIASLSVMLAACSTTPEGTTVSGTIQDAGGMKVFIDKTTLENKAMVLAQADAADDGSFEFAFPEGIEMGLYRLRIGAQKAYLVFSGDESQVTVNGQMEDFERYNFEIEGSDASEEFVALMQGVSNRSKGVEEIQDFMNNSKNVLAGVATGVLTLGRPEFAPNHAKAKQRMEQAYPQSEYTTEYVQFVTKLEAAYAQQQARERIKVGMPAPDITLEDPDGKPYSLSDLKGKVVLLDFWASWCGPCRRANPHVVQIYDKYKNDGFTVFSVSLDGLDSRTKARLPNEQAIETNMEASKQRWVQAIEKDQLKWEYHVSELAKWDTQAAKLYGVTGIPKTFLIDREGNIAAVNPRYNLEEALLKVL